MTIAPPTIDRRTIDRSSGQLRDSGVRLRRLPLDVKLFLAVAFMIPVQIELGGLSRLSPSDILLATLILVTPGIVRLRSTAADLMPVALMITLSMGALWALMRAGDATNHTIVVKFAGGFVLGGLAIVASTYARAGYTLPIIKSFLMGMVVWGLVAYVDWRVANILPFVEAKTETRFGGMQYDPNNAGAGYGVALVMGWLVGPRLFVHRFSWLFTMFICTAALALTLSRGGYIATLAGIAVVLLLERPTLQRGFRLAGAVLIVAVGAVVSGVVATAVDDFRNRPDTVSGRTGLAENGIREFIESGGIGIGLGTYRARYLDIIHNTGLWLLVEMSIIGVALLLVVAAVPAQRVFGVRQFDPKLASALMAAHVVMLVSSTGIEALYQRPWWLVMGLIAGVGAPEGTTPYRSSPPWRWLDRFRRLRRR